MFKTLGVQGILGDLEVKAPQMVGKAIVNVIAIIVFSLEVSIVSVRSSKIQAPSKHCFWKKQTVGSCFVM